jgi:hypothetical protein
MAGDASFANVGLLLKCVSADGATTFTDLSTNARTLTANGDVQVDTARPGFATSAALFDGTGDYISMANTNLYPTTQAEDFGISCRIYITAYPAAAMRIAGISDSGGTESWSFGITSSGAIFFNIIDSGTRQGLTAAAAVPLNTWVEVAGMKSGNNVYAYCGGTRGATVGTMVGTPLAPLSGVSVGRMGSFNGQYFAGWIDDRSLRIDKGLARHTGSTYTVASDTLPEGLGEITGTITDSAGAPAARVVRAYRRDTGALLASTTSNGGTGAYRLYTPTLDEVTVLALDDQVSGTYFNDVAARVIPA